MSIAVYSDEQLPVHHRRSLVPGFMRRNPFRGMTPEAQVASALVMVSEVREQSNRRKHMDWQDQALVYFDRIPEVAYAGEFYARAMPKLELGVGKLDWNPRTGETEVITDPAKIDKAAFEVLEGFQDPGGGREKFLSSYGRLMFLSGDGYAIKRTVTRVDQWEFLSHKEFRVKPGTGPQTQTGQPVYQRLEAPGLPYDELLAPPDDAWEDMDDDQAMCVRLWKPHPVYSWWAHSSLRALLGVCEELLLLEQAIHARLTSRAAAGGILFIPNSIANAIPESDPRTPEERAMTPMMRMVYRSFMTAIQQPGHPAGAVPIVLTGKDDAGALIKHIRLFDDTVTGWPEVANRESAVQRFATGADFPQEYLLGLKNLSHWNAWQIDDQTWAAHLQPITEMFVGDFGSACFRPQLVAKGMADEDADSYVVTYDESEIVTRPDKSAAAKDGYDRGIVAGEAYRRESGLVEDDAMQDDEYRRWVGIQVKDPNLALGGEVTPSLPANAPGAPQDPSNPDSPEGPVQDGPPPEPDGQPARPQNEGPPQQAPMPRRMPAGLPSGGLSETARILGAAEMAIMRCRELAGSRLAAKAQRCTDCKEKIRGVPKSMVAHTLGEDGLPIPTPAAAALTEGAMDSFIQILLAWGIDMAVATYLAGAVERHATETLWDADPIALPQELITYAEA